MPDQLGEVLPGQVGREWRRCAAARRARPPRCRTRGTPGCPLANGPTVSETPITPRPPERRAFAIIRLIAARRAWYSAETSGRAAPIAAAPDGRLHVPQSHRGWPAVAPSRAVDLHAVGAFLAAGVADVPDGGAEHLPDRLEADLAK